MPWGEYRLQLSALSHSPQNRSQFLSLYVKSRSWQLLLTPFTITERVERAR